MFLQGVRSSAPPTLASGKGVGEKAGGHGALKIRPINGLHSKKWKSTVLSIIPEIGS